jgi:threonine synthase
LLPNGRIAQGKLAQARIYGAEIVAIDGNFDDALRLVRELGRQPGVEVVNSVNPVRIEGQKTGAFEICDALGRAPDFHFLPVGNAGNITAYWRGFKEYQKANITHSLPKMMGWQAAGAAPIVEDRIVLDPQTIATAIRIGNPASWAGAKTAVSESGGMIQAVTDAEILEAYMLIAKTEGVFVEPATAAPIAGLLKLGKAGQIPSNSLITVTLTGHGLKDPDIAMKTTGADALVVPPRLEAVLEALSMKLG